MAKFVVKKNTNYTLTVSKTDYNTHTETINVSADTTKNITLTPSFTPETKTFNYTGAVQTYTIPNGCTKLIVDCVGAAGGDIDWSEYGLYYYGGKGGRVQCNLAVTPGQVLYIYVGECRNMGGDSTRTFGGGGSAGAGYGTAGGGASDIRIGGTALTDRKVVAGGGGGVVNNKGPGAGGGLTGGDSTSSDAQGTYFKTAKGGTQSAGGKGQLTGTCWSRDGSLGQGGDGGYDTCSSTQGGGAGGGGGYYGGGGCAAGVQDRRGDGAGGSSYTDPTLCTNVVHTQGYSQATGNGYVKITTSNT